MGNGKRPDLMEGGGGFREPLQPGVASGEERLPQSVAGPTGMVGDLKAEGSRLTILCPGYWVRYKAKKPSLSLPMLTP